MVSRRVGTRILLGLLTIAASCSRSTQSSQGPLGVGANDGHADALAVARTVPRPEMPPEPRCPANTAAIKRGRESALLCLDLSEVTVAEYAACVSGGACTAPKPYDTSIRLDRYQALCNWGHPEGRERHPINCVSYDQAKSYCASRGARLPTDVEWTIAASNGGQSVYPWGSLPPDGTRVNGCGRECPPGIRRLVGHADVVARYSGDDGFVGTAPAGTFPGGDNKLGVHDLAGNVAELVVPEAAPESAGDLTAGGGFLTQDTKMMSARVQTRTAWSGATSPDLGFRCIADAR
jgi:formylglycine-generating enzyme required for sulfatase activity